MTVNVSEVSYFVGVEFYLSVNIVERMYFCLSVYVVERPCFCLSENCY